MTNFSLRNLWTKTQPPDPFPRDLRQQINKRLTMNLLIHGAGTHAAFTAHHLVRDELESLRWGLTRFYDMFMASLQINLSLGELILFYGFPSTFWGRTHRTSHPCYRFPLLKKHGAELSRAEIKYTKALAWKARLFPIVPVLYTYRLLWHLGRSFLNELGIKDRLTELIPVAVSRLWGIDKSRLNPSIQFSNLAFGHIRPPRTAIGKLYSKSIISYGGVQYQNGQMMVVAKGMNFPLVLSETIRGTAELICLHGLCDLDETTYLRITGETDRFDDELWLLQIGPELWRRFINVIPQDRTTAEMLMHVARLDPDLLEDLMMAVIEDPDHARILLQNLGN